MADTTVKRKRGEGSIFRDAGSQTWRIKFSDHGKTQRESTGSSDIAVAKKLLKKRLAEVETQTFTPRASIRIQELFDDVVLDYQNEDQSTKQIQGRWRLHLADHFARRRASDIGSDHLKRYVKHRRDEGASAGTINRELALLRRCFNLGLESTPAKVRFVPHFPMLKESKPRQGFLKPNEYDSLAQACTEGGGLWMRSIFEIGATYGWRLRELTGLNGLKVSQINFTDNFIRLEVGTTKNGDGRQVSMTSVVRSLLTECCRGKARRDFVFTRDNGSPVISFRRAWEAACISAGVGRLLCRACDEVVDGDRHCGTCDRDWTADQVKYDGLIFHDLRRTAVSGMVNAGVSEKVAMTISGHKTRAIFDRYHIVPPSDLKAAARKMELHRAEQMDAASVTADTAQQNLEPSKLQ